jgi:hypothetical protein
VDHVDGEWGAFNEIMKRKDLAVQGQVGSLQMKIVAEDKVVEQKTQALLQEWEREKPIQVRGWGGLSKWGILTVSMYPPPLLSLLLVTARLVLSFSFPGDLKGGLSKWGVLTVSTYPHPAFSPSCNS